MSNSPGTSPSALEHQMVGTLISGQEPPLENEVEQPDGSEEGPAVRTEGTSPEPDEGPSPTSEESEGAEAAQAPSATPPAKPKRVLGYDDLLPLEQGDEYPEQLYSIAADKWKIPAEDFAKPWVQNFLKDKINTDILIKGQRHDAALRAAEPATTEAPGEEEPPLEPREPFEMGRALATSMESVSPLITEQGAQAYSDATVKSLQRMNEAMESGDEAELKKAQREFTTSQLSMLHMALQRLIPEILPSAIHGYASEATRVQSEIDGVYAKARALVAQDPEYHDMNDLFGTAEIRALGKSEFQKLLDELPELSTMRFRGKDGKFLGKVENAAAQYKYGIRFIRGGKPARPNEDSFKRGVEAGKKADEQRKRIAGAGQLGQGRPTSGGFATGQSDKDLQERLVERFNNDNPFAGKALGG